jgi:hypothetical protein
MKGWKRTNSPFIEYQHSCGVRIIKTSSTIYYDAYYPSGDYAWNVGNSKDKAMVKALSLATTRNLIY